VLEIQERPPSTLRNIDSGPLGGAGAVDLRAFTINAKKHQRWTPWEVPELEIQEHPPSMLRNVNGGPLRGAGAEDPGAPTINAKKHRWRAHERYRS
jgi:hypothetical protein